jgi:hypothetical protein
MKIPFVGGYNVARSQNASVQRSVNCYLEVDQRNERAPVALYGTPGLVRKLTFGTTPVRGGIRFSDSYSYWVAGNTVYRVDTSYTATSLGTISSSSGEIGLATNGTQVLIVDGSSGWIASGTTLTEIADADFPDGVRRAAYQDGYFLVTGDSSQKFYWNETPGSGTAWNGLDFASAEASPDYTVAILSDHRELWLFGAESAEIWVNTGDADSLFQRSGNTYITKGCVAAGTVLAMNNTVFWLGAEKDGQGIVYMAQGYNPVRVSTHALEKAIRGYSTITDAKAFTYQLDGHSFYVLIFPTANATWFYDAASQEWFEWSWRNPSDNTDNRHRANCCVFFNEETLVGDWETGELYALDADTYDDDGDPIRRKRITQTSSAEGLPLFFEELIIDMETGVGLATGQGSDPKIMLRYSDDNGHSWSSTLEVSIGQAGDYDAEVKVGPTGSGKNRAWELTMTDPVKWAIFGAWARVAKGD